MMLPFPLLGLAAAGTALISKYRSGSSANKRQFTLIRPVKKVYRRLERPTFAYNPLLPIVNDLRSKLLQAFKKPEKPDYGSIVRDLLPAGAKILTPQFPANSKQYLVTDIDDDSFNEIIASYEIGQEVRTAIFKQLSNEWYKAAEINHPGNSTLHYRGVASLSDDRKKQLMIGIKSGSKLPLLSGYAINNNSIYTLFDRHYHRFEITGQSSSSRNQEKQQLAIWDRDDMNSYIIDLFNLKNNFLAADDNIEFYYRTKVIPFYAGLIRKSPYDVTNWYNFAKALNRIKADNDALAAIDIGTELDTDSKFKERFEDLRNSLN